MKYREKKLRNNSYNNDKIPQKVKQKSKKNEIIKNKKERSQFFSKFLVQRMDQRIEHRNKIKVDFMSGFISGMITVSICSPLEVARTRLNLMQITEYGKNKYKGFFNTLSTIYKEEGMRGMYSGFKITILAAPLFHSLFFSIYNYMKPFVQKKLPEKNNFLMTEVTCSLIGGFVSDFVTNPLWV